MMRHFEDEHCQAQAVFTMTLSSAVFIDCVNQHHYHKLTVPGLLKLGMSFGRKT